MQDTRCKTQEDAHLLADKWINEMSEAGLSYYDMILVFQKTKEEIRI